MGKPKTKILRLEQEVLEPWKEELDIYDAALIHHVYVRLNRRKNQKTIVHDSVPCVWVHYPTVREENWLIRISPDGLKKRFAKLVRLRLLVRKQVNIPAERGERKGSRTFYGISNTLKKRFEELDAGENSVGNQTTGGDDGIPHSYGGDDGIPRYGGDDGIPQSLSMSQCKREKSTPPPGALGAPTSGAFCPDCRSDLTHAERDGPSVYCDNCSKWFAVGRVA